MKRIFTLALCCGLFFAFFGTSCKKFENGQTVPAYIHIDSITLDPNLDYNTYGANTTNITDAWVYVDDQIIGCYELPATFPVLKNGRHKVSIYGGIKVGGISAARAPYPFYQPRIYKAEEAINLVEDSIVILNPIINYYSIDDIKMQWKEDFESGSITLNAMAESDTALVHVSGNEALLLADFPEFSAYSGKVVLPPDSLHFYLSSFNELKELPTNGDYCMLELDYNCNAPFTVGMIYCTNYLEKEAPLVTIQPTDTVNALPHRWKKIYINIGPICVEHEDASYFKVYLTSHVYNSIEDGYVEKVPDYQRYYYFDNLKLISR